MSKPRGKSGRGSSTDGRLGVAPAKLAPSKLRKPALWTPSKKAGGKAPKPVKPGGADKPTMTERVWLAQCLCPQRHCILAGSGLADERSAPRIKQVLTAKVAQALASGVFNPYCGLCHAPAESWTYEVARTRYRTMAEAAPELRERERQQIQTARLMRTGGTKH